MMTRSAILILILIVSGGNFSCSSKEPCEDLKGRIHEDLRKIYPYTLDVQALVFENDNGEDFRFDVSHMEEDIVTINSNGTYPYEAQELRIQFYNSDLNIFLNTRMYGGYATYMCPEEASPVSFVSITGPLPASVPVSDPVQSQNLIIVQLEDEDIVIDDSDINFFTWGGQVYNEVYDGTGGFDIYFNFDIGIIGFVDPVSVQNFYHKETITQ